MDYEIEPSQDPLDRPPNAEWCDQNADCFGYEDDFIFGASFLSWFEKCGLMKST